MTTDSDSPALAPGRTLPGPTLVGTGLIVVALAFVALHITASWDEVASWSPRGPVGGPLLGLIAAATLASAVTMGVWIAALAARGPLRAPMAELARIHALTQIGKYLPGNVLHIAGRHVATRRSLGSDARKEGVRADAAIAGAVVVEAAILTVSAAITVVMFANLWPYGGSGTVLGVASRFSGVSTVVPVVAVSMLVGVALRFSKPRGRPLRGWPLLLGLLLGSVFFAGQALILLAVSALVSGGWTGTVLAVAPVGWLLGFLTPGAPAGLGVREAVLIGLLGPMLGAGDAVLVAGFFRLVTLGGDLVLFSAAAVPGRRLLRAADRIG